MVSATKVPEVAAPRSDQAHRPHCVWCGKDDPEIHDIDGGPWCSPDCRRLDVQSEVTWLQRWEGDHE